VAFLLVSAPASAHPNEQEQPPCDFLTGGGFIITTASGMHAPAKANFGVGGGCKHGSPTWGHLQYIDHGNALNVHWTAITAYLFVDQGEPSRGGQPTGTRRICGTARTNLFGDVDFVVQAKDTGEPGRDDEFIIRLEKFGVEVYTTQGDSDHTLGGDGPGGGNIQLHKPNPSTTGSFGGSCPALP
jgi:hypothetical protein